MNHGVKLYGVDSDGYYSILWDPSIHYQLGSVYEGEGFSVCKDEAQIASFFQSQTGILYETIEDTVITCPGDWVACVAVVAEEPFYTDAYETTYRKMMIVRELWRVPSDVVALTNKLRTLP
jgi:hypothetical protein